MSFVYIESQVLRSKLLTQPLLTESGTDTSLADNELCLTELFLTKGNAKFCPRKEKCQDGKKILSILAFCSGLVTETIRDLWNVKLPGSILFDTELWLC